MFVVFIFQSIVMTMTAGPGEGSAPITDWGVRGAIFLGLVVLAPLVEELAFRGFAFNLLDEAGYRRLAIFLPAIAWALAHTQYDWTLQGFLVVHGILMALARQRTGSLWPSIAMHVLWNLACSAYLFAPMG